MMLPTIRPVRAPMPVITSPPPRPNVPAATDDHPHTDYNLHPLLVHSLEHYALHDDDERFHVV